MRWATVEASSCTVKDGHSVVLRHWLTENGIRNADDVERLFVALNQSIAQKGEDLMIGHSYFMREEAVDEKQSRRNCYPSSGSTTSFRSLQNTSRVLRSKRRSQRWSQNPAMPLRRLNPANPLGIFLPFPTRNLDRRRSESI